MAFAAGAWIEEHPYTTAGIGIVGVVVLYFLYAGSSSASSTQVQVGSSDPYNDPGVINSEIQASSQLQQIQAQGASQVNQANAQLALDAQDNANSYAIAQLTAQTNNLQAEYQYYNNLNVAETNQNEAQIAADTQTTSINATEAVNLQQIDSNQAIVQLNDQAAITENAASTAANVSVAGIVGQTQSNISANQTSVAIAQTQAAENIADTASKNSLFGTIASSAFGLAGKIF